MMSSMPYSSFTDLFFKSTALPFLSTTVKTKSLPSFIRFPTPGRRSYRVLQQFEEKNRLNDAERSPVIGRREALGFGMSLSLVPTQSHQNNVQAAESDPPCELSFSASGLAFCDKIIGHGPKATKGLVKVHYLGKLENGKIFESSYDRGEPLIFRLGTGEVIKGLDKGILGTEGIPPMLAGGKRTLRIAPPLGYGARGAGCGSDGSCIIPPNSVLQFDIEFISNL